MKEFRGSQKHVLDLLDSADYLASLQPLLAPHGITVSATDARRPIGGAAPQEWELPSFCRTHCSGWIAKAAGHGDVWASMLTTWWLRHNDPQRGKLPTWDLISTCHIKDHKGLLLVEAKAHESELSTSGKASIDSATARSKENHEQITLCIESACKVMRQQVDSRIAISVDRHYQLSNRLAWAWRLAEHGLNVALLYLGFVGDLNIAEDYFRDADHWQRAIGAYMSGVVPVGLPGRFIDLPGGGSLILLVESLPIIAISSPAKPHRPQPRSRAALQPPGQALRRQAELPGDADERHPRGQARARERDRRGAERRRVPHASGRLPAGELLGFGAEPAERCVHPCTSS